MVNGDMIFTSESVTRGHPDKLCDQISDAVVDAFLRQDPKARITAECAIATGVVFVAARFSGEASVDIPQLARRVIAEAGYEKHVFDAQRASILTSFSEVESPAGPLHPQSPADEQVNAFGYACDDCETLMPLPIDLAHRFARRLDDARNECPDLGPDGKVQVSVQYKDGRPVAIADIAVTSALLQQLAPSDHEAIIRDLVLAPPLPGGHPVRVTAATRLHVNPGGSFLYGGPAHHAGLTGRKTGIDTYGDFARQSGSALSGKDIGRIDRTGAYMARLAAKAIVAAGLARRAEVHLAYAIGEAEPSSLAVNCFGTSQVAEAEIGRRLSALLDFRPGAIAERFAFAERVARAGTEGFFRPLACYGHMGRADLDVPWEDAVDLAEALRR
ncbi:S-adenosylmethionine synthase [Hartmannibacter diazotrophicus]|uniref:Methionine adenosyltransferase n=1 Tax=Hartmannibacter diazotrophicus TaxID=1482074 RepID=A0A2C9D179_9HYPH|nr:methionine adenosyltransferase [Hartmannibacter diazotrophicus]SON53939.1 S-adenosylmethionine synthase [Hartmannibacter diazotrophicus]